MTDIKDINERLYQTSLASVEWAVLSRTARLVFRDEETQLILHLEGIHSAMFRPTLRSAVPSFGPDCHVFYADISQDTGFLDKYLNDKTLLPSHVVPHDEEGRVPTDVGFQRPFHLAIVCVCGHLDFLFNSVAFEAKEGR